MHFRFVVQLFSFMNGNVYFLCVILLMNKASNCSQYEFGSFKCWSQLQSFQATDLDLGAPFLPQNVNRSKCCNALLSLLDHIQVQITANVARKHLFSKYWVKTREFLYQSGYKIYSWTAEFQNDQTCAVNVLCPFKII